MSPHSAPLKGSEDPARLKACLASVSCISAVCVQRCTTSLASVFQAGGVFFSPINLAWTKRDNQDAAPALARGETVGAEEPETLGHRTPHPPFPRLNPRRIAWAPVLRVRAFQAVNVEPLASLARLTRWWGFAGLLRGLPDLWPASEGYAHRERIHAVSFIP